MSTISRRDLFKFGGVRRRRRRQGIHAERLRAAGKRRRTDASPTRAPRPEDGLPSLLRDSRSPSPTSLETKDFDVVVVGAGAAGVPAALAAFEAGAKVALLQKEATAISQGNTCDSIILDQTDPAGRRGRRVAHHGGLAAIGPTASRCACGRYNSGEALKWLWDTAEKAGAQVVGLHRQMDGAPIKQIDGYDITYFAYDFGPKPYNTGRRHARHRRLTPSNRASRSSTPRRPAQLVQEDGGAVTGVIAEGEDGYVQFNAPRASSWPQGDYENDDEMMAYYEAEMANIYRKEQNKTGDGPEDDGVGRRAHGGRRAARKCSTTSSAARFDGRHAVPVREKRRHALLQRERARRWPRWATSSRARRTPAGTRRCSTATT